MANNSRMNIVLTGGPCAGKTTIAQVLEKAFADKIVILPESASLLFKGGFPRWSDEMSLRSLQGSIYAVQTELEKMYGNRFPDKTLIMDRGTIDGAAYWPGGPEDFFKNFGSSHERELARYQKVIYLESAGQKSYEENLKRNPARTETWAEAHKLDELTRSLWIKHSNLVVIRNNTAFSEKIAQVLRVVESCI